MNGVHRTTNGPFSPRLISAVQRDEPEYLQEVLETKKHMIGLDDLSKALLLAADKGADECARILLSAGALPNLHDPLGWTPVVVAAKKGNANVLKVLAKAGANVSRPTNRVRATGLHWAASQGHYDCVKVLLDADAKIEARTSSGRTALMQAARSGFDDIVHCLINNGAEVNGKDFGGVTALHLAAEEGNTSIMRLLLKEGANIDAQMKNGDTPIMRAAIRGQTKAVKLLINKNCNLKLCGHQLTPLHWAAEAGHTECLQLLLDAGTDPNICTKDSYHGADFVVNAFTTPLMLAARKGHVDAIKFLVNSKVDIHAMDSDGRTAFLYAVRANNSEAILALLRAGADIDGNQSDSPHAARISPLFYAIRENFETSFKTLLRANCNMFVTATIKDGRHVGPLECALSKERIAISKMLVIAGIGQFVINPSALQEGLIWLLGVDEGLSEWIMKSLNSVQSLMQLSRLAIRQSIGRPILPEYIESLPLPPRLLSYLDFCDFDD